MTTQYTKPKILKYYLNLHLFVTKKVSDSNTATDCHPMRIECSRLKTKRSSSIKLYFMITISCQNENKHRDSFKITLSLLGLTEMN